MDAATVQRALAQGLEHHQAGRLTEAEALYRLVLQQQPENPDALHFLGMLAHQIGRDEAAVDLMRQSIALVGERTPAGWYSNLGEALLGLGRSDEAMAAHRQAIALKPDYVEAHNNLGNALRAAGRVDEAVREYLAALKINPDAVHAHCNIGAALAQQGRLDAAVEHYRRAIVLQPLFPEALNNLGNALRLQGEHAEAAECYRKAIAIRADFPEAHNNLGNALGAMGKTGEAVASYRRALELRPEYAEAMANLGSALARQGQVEEGMAQCRRAIERQPGFAPAWCNLGKILQESGRVDGAIESYTRAVEVAPKFAAAKANLGGALQYVGRVEEAIGRYREAVALQPEPARHSDLLLMLLYHGGTDASAAFGEHQRWGRTYTPKRRAGKHGNDRDPKRRLRIGYISPDLRRHSVAFFVEPVLANHDPKKVEVFCYSNAEAEDAVTQRLKGYAPQWRGIAAMRDEQVVEQIRADGIDILIDLAGHTAGNRLPVLAHKPAPLQATWLGYPGTTGLEAVDYRISDGWLDPVGQTERWHTEQLVRLPRTFACYRPPAEAPAVGGLPAERNGFVTFASFAALVKVSEAMLRSWAAILRGTPRSRLLLMAPAVAVPSVQERLRALFAGEGIEADRVELQAARPFEQFLADHNRVDVILDTYPFNGHTTTCHALWMGVPVVSLAGPAAPSRLGQSVSSNLGLGELAATSREDYERVAMELAGDVVRLSRLRAGMRSLMSKSPLRDERGVTRELEEAHRRVWQAWCAAGR